MVSNSKESRSYEGALVCAFLRKHLLINKLSFSFETVMSHVSKVDEIRTSKLNGYKTYLYFICIDDPEVNISRVENRVEKGGHFVPKEKISNRYFSTLNNLIQVLDLIDKCYFFDNSGTEYKLIAKISSGKLMLEVDSGELPNWFIQSVLRYYL
jgi:predicted ABC-type ATPase